MNARKEGKKAEGSALISALIFSSLLFVVAASYLLMISSEYRLNDRSYRGAVAIHLAEGGVDYAIQALESGDISNWAGTNPKTKTLYAMQTAGGKALGDVQMEVFDPQEKNPIVTSAGYVPDMGASKIVERQVRVELGSVGCRPFNAMLFADISIDMSGQAFTDSYDSRLGEYNCNLGGGQTNLFSNGSAGTNGITGGAISLSGQAIIKGDAATGPGGTIEMSGQAEVTGEQSHDMELELPPVEVPPECATIGYWEGTGLLSLSGKSNYTLEPGNYKFKRIKMSGQTSLTINGPANIYITGYSGKSIDQSGQSEISCNGQVNVYCDDDVKLSGQGVYNMGQVPADLIVFGTPTCDWVKYSGQAEFYGVVYAPQALVDPSGQAGVFGAFIGLEMDVSGQSGFHYDEALGDLEVGGASGYKVNFWQEKE